MTMPHAQKVTVRATASRGNHFPLAIPPETEDRKFIMLNRKRLGLVVLVSTASVTLAASPAFAAAPASASCTGQFFSSHAGLGAAHTGETVGSFIWATARALGPEFGATISGARALPRNNCGL